MEPMRRLEAQVLARARACVRVRVGARELNTKIFIGGYP